MTPTPYTTLISVQQLQALIASGQPLTVFMEFTVSRYPMTILALRKVPLVLVDSTTIGSLKAKGLSIFMGRWL